MTSLRLYTKRQPFYKQYKSKIMAQEKKLTIGLFGFGVVGEGIYNVLQQASSINATIKKICIKHANKKRAAPAELFTTSYEALLEDDEINVIVELIDDADEAYKIVTASLHKGKAVVSANKKLIAEHLPELLALQGATKTSFLYEAAVAGSIPILRNLEEYYDNDLLHGMQGVINGSTNYILDKVIEHNLTYKEALLEAQQAGFAESNPELDVSGRDAVNKLTLLLAHAYGIVTSPDHLICRGIQEIQDSDVRYAKEKGFRIKLVAHASKLRDGDVTAFVLPQFVTPGSQLYNVKQEFNGIILKSHLADEQFLYGKGAGRYPTASAVISDISALRYGYRYEYKKYHAATESKLTEDYFIKVYVGFDSWADVNKWDFENIDELYSTEGRQHLVGLIHAKKFKEADWISNPAISIIACPNPVVSKEEIVGRSLKKISLQLAGAR
jgi:homoserine dehydrogenase